MAVERQEIYCHSCEGYVQFEIDTSLNGNHVLNCPKCGHEHCRVVKDGKITGDRWDNRNPTYFVSPNSTTITASSTYITCTSTSYDLYTLWVNTTAYL